MTNADSARRSPGGRARAADGPAHRADVVRRASGALRIARADATALAGRVPGTVHTTRAGAQGVTRALQTLPDTTLRWMLAASVGLGAGLSLAGAPRVVTALGVTPAVLMGAAIVLRPDRAPRRPANPVG